MDPFPPSRAEAVRLARERGEGLGEKVLPAGSQRRLQPVVDKFFYSLAANAIETQRLGLWWANRMLATDAAARREADALLARPLRDRREQGARLPDDAPAERDVSRAAPPATLRDLLVGILKDPGDARLSRQRREHQEASERELRPRAARAVLDGRRQLHRARRARGRARVHRLDQRRAGRSSSTPTQHDSGEKTFLGRTGPFNGEDIIDIILEQPVTAEFVSAKLYRYFVRDEISAPVQARARPHVPRQRLSDQAAAEADLPLEGFLQPARRTRRRSRARCSSWSRPTGSWGCARCRRFPTSAA